MQSTAQTIDKPLGVIDALRDGFDLINHRPWLLVLPILLDLLLWFAPRLSPAPLVARYLDLLLAQPDVPADFTENIAAFSDQMREAGDGLNLLSLLAGSITGFPSFLARLDATAAVAAVGEVIQIDSIPDVLLYTLLLIPIGLLIGSVWLTLIVYNLDSDLSGLKDALRRTGWVWLNTGLYLVVLVVAAAALTGVFAIFLTILAVLAGSVGLALANIMWLLFIWFILWIAIGLSFVINAIALDGVNVARAVWRSVNVVGRNFPATLGLMVLAMLLTEGFAIIWLRLSANSWGIPLGILGNAYIGAALTVAGLLFYRARYQHWQRIRSEVASNRKQEQE